jgi:hypothetical protein
LPFLLIDGQAAVSDAVVGDGAVLVTLGLLALVVVGSGFSKHDTLRTLVGFSLGVSLLVAPWIVPFTQTVPTVHATMIGTGLILISLIEGYQRAPDSRSW